ncbi:MAG: hypothetical protein IJY62_04710 [Clostridia bacterium]|nr:hypothetical protein [Clostridia bacterium]
MRTKNKHLLVSLCSLGFAVSLAFAGALINDNPVVAETASGDLEAHFVMPNNDTATVAYTKTGVLFENAADNHKFRILTANLDGLFATENVTSFILEVEQYTVGWLGPIIFDKYGNYYQAIGAATNPSSESGKFEYKTATTLAGLEEATTKEIGGWGSVGGVLGKHYYEFSIESFMWRYVASSNYFTEANTLATATGKSFDEFNENNALMGVGLINYTSNTSSFKYSMNGFYARTNDGIYSLVDMDKLTVSTAEITATSADKTPNTVFQAAISGTKLSQTSDVEASLLTKEVSAFNGVQARLYQNSQYKVAGFSLDPTGANAQFNGKIENAESIIIQVGTSKSPEVKIRPLIIDQYGRHMEFLGSGTPPHTDGFYYRVGRTPENLTYQRDNGTAYSTIGKWSGASYTGASRYLEIPVTEFAYRGRFNNYGDKDTAVSELSYYSTDLSIGIKALGVIVTNTPTSGSVFVGDMYYRNVSGEIIKLAAAEDFTISETFTEEVGKAFDFGTSLNGVNSQVKDFSGYLGLSVVKGEIGRNYTAPSSTTLFEARFPQIKSSSVEKDFNDANSPVSDYSGFEAFAYNAYNLDETDLTLDFYVQVRKVDASWGADRYANGGKALFLPANGKAFVGVASVVPAGFYGQVIIPLSGAGFKNLSRGELKIVTSTIFGKVTSGSYVDALISDAKLLKSFPTTLINAETGTMFGLNGEYTLPKITFVNGETEVSSEFFTGEGIKMPTAPAAAEGKVFIGWQANGKLYPSDYVLTSASENMTFEAVYIDFGMKDGASVRVTAPTGIRFRAELVKADYEALVALVGEENVTLGMRVVRGGTAYLDIEAINTAEMTIGEAEHVIYNGVIVNIDKANYETAYCGTGYVEITYADGSSARIYAVAGDNTRTVAEVAREAYEKDASLTEDEKKAIKKYFETTQEGA